MTNNDFTYEGLLREAFELTKKHFLFLLGLLLICIVLGGLTAKIPIISQVVSIALSIAFTWVALLIVGGHTPKYKDMLHPFRNYHTILHYVLAVLALCGIFLVGAVVPLLGYIISRATGSLMAFGIAVTVFAPAVIYALIRLGFFRFFIIEHQSIGPIESLKKSLHMTRGRFWKIVGLVGILLLLNLIGLIALVVGLVFTIPMSWLAVTLLYKKWSGQSHETHHHLTSA